MSVDEWIDGLPPTLTVETAAALLGIGRTTAYIEAARFRSTGGAHGLPNFRMGSRVVVPKAPLVEMLRRGAGTA